MSKYSYDDLTYEYLHSIFTYDSETGDLYWKPRPRDMFKRSMDWKTWSTKFANARAGSLHKRNDGYCSIHLRLLNKRRLAHRIVWFMHYGEWPKDQIDHINGIATDNRIENLRDVRGQDNQRNLSRRSDNTSGTTGVHWSNSKKKWEVYISSNYLGCFTHKEEAIAARKEAEIKYGYHENHGRENPNATG
jgi:hypothetical protein